MSLLNDNTGNDPIDIQDRMYIKIVGQNIARIRKERKLTQQQLGDMLGLTAVRVQQYESGFRKPKNELLKRFAEALEVSTFTLRDPFLFDDVSAMYIFFKMQEKFGLSVDYVNDQLVLTVTDRSLSEYLRDWHEKTIEYYDRLAASKTPEEMQAAKESYNDWIWNFPDNLVKAQRKRIDERRKNDLRNQIAELQSKLDILENQENEE